MTTEDAQIAPDGREIWAWADRWPQFGAERRHDQVQRFRDEPIEREDSRDG